jgi:cell division protease FtsH
MGRQGGGPGGGRGIFSFGKSKARQIDTSKMNISFQDVAGCDEAKDDLKEVVDFLKDPKKYDNLGGRIPTGALLLGPPGTGKTLLAKAVAGEAGVPFFSMSGSDFVEMFVGVGASRVRDLFETGKKHAPCIVFIDEIDAVGRQRGAGVGGGHDEREQTLNQLLVEMDGIESNEGVILIAATNRSDVLDKALLRPGRFDRQIVVDAPDARGREAILKVHIRKRKVPIADDVDLSVVSKGTPGMSGAEMENLVNEAALMAARYNAKKVSMIDFEEAKDKLMIGPERRSRVMTPEELKTTAYHEAGHALITHLVDNSDTLHKLTIIPRGMALGITFSLPEKDRYTMDKDYLEDQIAIMLGGRGAEILFFNQRNTGASNDIERATEIAYRMVTEWGMTDELGPICYRKKKSDPFLGRDMGESSNFSDVTAVKIDEVVRDIVQTQLDRVSRLLEENQDTLKTLAEALLQHEVLDREEILKVLDGEELESSKKTRQHLAMVEAKIEREKELELKEQALKDIENSEKENSVKGTAIDAEA